MSLATGPYEKALVLICNAVGEVLDQGGNLFSAKGHLDIYKTIRGPYRIINLKMCLLYLVKHLINSPLLVKYPSTLLINGRFDIGL